MGGQASSPRLIQHCPAGMSLWCSAANRGRSGARRPVFIGAGRRAGLLPRGPAEPTEGPEPIPRASSPARSRALPGRSERYCRACGTALTGRQRNACSGKCRACSPRAPRCREREEEGCAMGDAYRQILFIIFVVAPVMARA
jgi:hypothetical protein